jgi:hypothetical protein
MTEELLDKLKQTDIEALEQVVQLDQRDPDFTITSWDVELFSTKGFGGAEGLFLFKGSGHGKDAGSPEQPWSVALKVQKEPETEAPPWHYYYWKRELLAAQSHWLAELSSPVRAQRYFLAEMKDGFAWLWMEHLHESVQQLWTRQDYIFAAQQLGQWHAAFLNGAAAPDEPWLCRDHLHGWLGDITADSGWDNDLVSAQYSSEARARHRDLIADMEKFIAILNRLPQVFSHFDFQRRNLFICAGEDGKNEVVAIDWALCGLGPLGADLFHLAGISSFFFEADPAQVRELDQAVFSAYLGALRAAGWTGDARLPRLGYCIWGALYSGGSLPSVSEFLMSEFGQEVAQRGFGLTTEEILEKWVPTMDYLLDLADEARRLAAELNME